MYFYLVVTKWEIGFGLDLTHRRDELWAEFALVL